MHGDDLATSHLQFVDDTLHMGLPTVQEAMAIKNVLNLFMEVSNASINQGKSQVFFFKTSPTVQKNITRILGFQRSSLASKYLGAPLVENALHNASWEDLVSKLGRKLSSWKFRALNLPTRLNLIKSFIQAMSLYLFFVFIVLKYILKAICNLQRTFLWGGSKSEIK